MHHSCLIFSLFIWVTVHLSRYDLRATAQAIDKSVSLPTDNTSKTSDDNPTIVTVCSVVETGNPGFMIDYNRFAAALDIAVKHSNDGILPKHIKLIRRYKNGGLLCTPKNVAIKRILEWVEEGVNCDVYIGPGCNEHVKDAYNVAEFRKKVIFGCPGANIVSRTGLPRSAYPNLMRTSYSASGVAKTIITFLDYFNYTHTSVITNNDDVFYAELGDSLRSRLRLTRGDLYKRATFLYILNDRQNSSNVSLNEAVLTTELRDVNMTSRVIILFANAATVRNIMVDAFRNGMTNGEYVFIGVELFPSNTWGRFLWEQDDEDDEDARSAFRSLILISLVKTFGSYMEDFSDAVRDLAFQKYNYKFGVFDQVDPITLAFYDAYILYATAVRLLYESNQDFTDAGNIVNVLRNQTFLTPLQTILRIDPLGDKIILYDMKNFDDHRGIHVSFLRMDFSSDLFTWLNPLQWPSGTGSLPPDVPRCGFKGTDCRDDNFNVAIVIIATVIPALIIFSGIGAGLYYFVSKNRAYLDPNWWQFRLEEIQFPQDRTPSSAYRLNMASQSINTSKKTRLSAMTVTASPWTYAILNGNTVSLKPLTEKTFRPTPEVIKQLNQVQTIRHGNLQRFIGLCLNDVNWIVYVIAEHCQKGCLDDLIDQKSVTLDWSFKFSLITDITEGMVCLHGSLVQSHGFLTSLVCLIDSRFSVKISDYGTTRLRDSKEFSCLNKTDEQRDLQPLLWRAPELLRETMPQRGSQKGDIYSFAIILQQIILRAEPFESSSTTGRSMCDSPLELLFEIKTGTTPPIRPPVSRSACSAPLFNLMESCWSEFPVERPSFLKIKEMVRKMSGLSGGSLVDHLLKRMEKYASELEEQVAVKTQQFMDEKQRSEQLLGQLLPKAVAQCLIKGESVFPEYFEMVTVYFSDIVGFTKIAAASTPMDVISLLNDLYTLFDEVVEKHDAYKVETTGDAYMVASGLPIRNGTNHALEVATVAWEILLAVKTVKIPQQRNEQLRIRSGVHSGSCVAGIVGIKTPRYCLFGDSINTASRMESTGESMKIQVTESTKDLLENVKYFSLHLRGQVDVKGKGLMTTYWLEKE